MLFDVFRRLDERVIRREEREAGAFCGRCAETRAVGQRHRHKEKQGDGYPRPRGYKPTKIA